MLASTSLTRKIGAGEPKGLAGDSGTRALLRGKHTSNEMAQTVGAARFDEENSAQNKTPQTHSSHGTYVDQPSPKCCSIRRLNGRRVRVNSQEVLLPRTKVSVGWNCGNEVL